ncbi:MAG: DUF1761 domain-containing protein [Candidatus Levybacteria bacterium]|nr:DUF1761 domain-containing protein [Candidatus Levybacteria bacterium]MBP9815547.1 DUF1761 domain-containing protein [Candidatus Levybacteria bacterium]
MEFEINYLAILASGVVMMFLGYLWYGPLFGKPWMKLVGMTKSSKKNNMAKEYVLMAISSLVLAYVFDHILIAFGSNTLVMALQGAIWTWLGFIATSMLGGVLWLKRPLSLYFIDAGYYLVGMILIGIILTFWK